METPAFFYAVFLWCLLISVTGYSIYIGFGPPSKDLRDPFEEHEDKSLVYFGVCHEFISMAKTPVTLHNMKTCIYTIP